MGEQQKSPDSGSEQAETDGCGVCGSGPLVTDEDDSPDDIPAVSTEEVTVGEGISTLPSDREHVSLSVTVPVDGMSDEEVEVLKRLATLYEQNFTEVVNKNKDYRWSFLATGQKLASSRGTPFDSPARSQAYGLLTRTGDKRERLIENVFSDGSPEVSDEPAVTAQEAANYYLFLALVLDNPQLCASVGTADGQ